MTRLVTVFTIATSRGAEVARELLGTAARKVVISDRLQELRLDQAAAVLLGASPSGFPGDDRPGRRVGRGRSAVAGALRAAVRLVAPGAGRDDGPGQLPSRCGDHAAPFREDLQRRGVRAACAKTAGTCRELLAGETHLWTFVRVEGVEPTNNDAERALRHGVIYRKLSGGTDSESGSRFVERMLTVVATCRQQDINVLDYLTRCYQAHLDGQPAPSLIPASSTAQAA